MSWLSGMEFHEWEASSEGTQIDRSPERHEISEECDDTSTARGPYLEETSADGELIQERDEAFVRKKCMLDSLAKLCLLLDSSFFSSEKSIEIGDG